MSSSQAHLRPEKLVLFSVVIGALALAGCAVAALSSNSLTIKADLLNAVLAFSGDAVLLGAMRIVRNARWAALDYGPGKIENLGSFLVALVMLLGLVGLGIQLLGAVREPEPIRGIGVLIGLIVSLGFCSCDTWLWRQACQAYRRSPSPLLDAFRRASLNAALVGGMAAVTLGLSLFFHGSWLPYLDIFTAIVLGMFAAHHAHQIIRHSLRDLVDQAIAEPLQIIINRHLVQHFESYLHLEGVRSRCAGSTVFIEIFLGFDPQQSIGQIQGTVDMLRAGLERDIPSARVTVIPRSHDAGLLRPHVGTT